ncbi:hypothetical protein NDU88_005019 [Pleurodeles waltl]|uniref:Secreted protein n=1 Tax=Pleurodeles waltl TaxID=8319 RepID=A0AAV7UHZ5_PLEWA|nr:hypothetical protein NDU88_005019 [Pleurodeles waltl]
MVLVSCAVPVPASFASSCSDCLPVIGSQEASLGSTVVHKASAALFKCRHTEIFIWLFLQRQSWSSHRFSLPGRWGLHQIGFFEGINVPLLPRLLPGTGWGEALLAQSAALGQCHRAHLTPKLENEPQKSALNMAPKAT